MRCADYKTQQSTVIYSNRFSAVKELCSKRAMPPNLPSSTQYQRNPKHASMLMENGIIYDKPLPPIQIAASRADRIAREKALEVLKLQQLVQSQAIQAHTSNIQQIRSGQVSKPGLTSPGRQTAIPLSGSASNVVNPYAPSAITKKINQQTASKTLLGNTTLQQTLLGTVVSASDQSQQMQQHQPQIQIQQPGQAVIRQCSQQLTKQQQQTQLQLQKQKMKPVKARLTPRKLQITAEAMKRQQQQQLEGDVVTIPGKKRKATIIHQELEELFLKSPTMRKQMPKSQTTKVQKAPVHARVQAKVQEATAQQAAQHNVAASTSGQQLQQKSSAQQPVQLTGQPTTQQTIYDSTECASHDTVDSATATVCGTIVIAGCICDYCAGVPSTAVSAQDQMALSTLIQQNADILQLPSLQTPRVGLLRECFLNAMRPTVHQQHHHLVLSRFTSQQTSAISAQNPPMVTTSPMTTTTMTLAASLMQLPTSVIPSVVGSQSQPQMAQPPIADGSSGLPQQ